MFEEGVQMNVDEVLAYLRANKQTLLWTARVDCWERSFEIDGTSDSDYFQERFVPRTYYENWQYREIPRGEIQRALDSADFYSLHSNNNTEVQGVNKEELTKRVIVDPEKNLDMFLGQLIALK